MAERTISPAVEKLVDLTELRYRLPGTNFRFGWDAIIGLIPGIGDLVGVALGAIVIFEAVRLRIGYSVLGRMLFNLWIDGMVGAVPVLGDLWDAWFKANRRNLQLLREHV